MMGESAMRRDDILQNIYKLRENIEKESMDPDHPPALLPVTKTQSIEDIAVLREAGIAEIGENRVQEILQKHPALSADFAFHMIGQLQTNKIRHIIGRVCMVQSVDRLALAQALDARCQASGLRMPILIEVNVGGEHQKAGIAPDEVKTFAQTCAGMPGLLVRGLMTVMPYADDPETIRPLFRRMRALYEALRGDAGEGMSVDVLSMGMSGDWKIAAQEGSTLLRVGSAIFGPRGAQA